MSVVLPFSNDKGQQNVASPISLRDFTLNIDEISGYAGIDESNIITTRVDQTRNFINCYSTSNVRQTDDIEIKKNNISLQMSIYFFQR